MKLLHAFSQRLYLRIWLAVVVGVAVVDNCAHGGLPDSIR